MTTKKHLNEIERLIKTIRERFPEYPVPKDNEIFGKLPQETELDLEIRQFLEKYRGHPWTSFTPNSLYDLYSSVWFLAPTGFCYYFPAFLTCTLLSDFDEGSMLVDTTARVLVPKPGGGDGMYTRDEMARKFACYNSDQLKAILEFVEFSAPFFVSKQYWWSNEAIETARSFWLTMVNQAKRERTG